MVHLADARDSLRSASGEPKISALNKQEKDQFKTYFFKICWSFYLKYVNLKMCKWINVIRYLVFSA